MDMIGDNTRKGHSVEEMAIVYRRLYFLKSKFLYMV